MECTVHWVADAGMVMLAETASGHTLTMDGAPEGGGRNLAPRPMETLLAGAGGCTAYDIVLILQRGRQLGAFRGQFARMREPALGDLREGAANAERIERLLELGHPCRCQLQSGQRAGGKRRFDGHVHEHSLLRASRPSARELEPVLTCINAAGRSK